MSGTRYSFVCSVHREQRGGASHHPSQRDVRDRQRLHEEEERAAPQVVGRRRIPLHGEQPEQHGRVAQQNPILRW